MTGASVISSKAVKDNKAFRPFQFQWDSDYLVFTVREPYPSTSTEAKIVFGKIQSKNALKITSQMPENGVIFSDGIETDFLEFNAGIEATISVAEKKGHLVI